MVMLLRKSTYAVAVFNSLVHHFFYIYYVLASVQKKLNITKFSRMRCGSNDSLSEKMFFRNEKRYIRYS